MEGPKIETAVPRRRYQIGDLSAVVLGDVASRDGHDYAFVMAFVPDGERSPVLYVTSEWLSPGGGEERVTIARVIAEGGERVLGPEPRWQDLDLFAEDAMAMARRVMGLGQEEAMRLL